MTGNIPTTRARADALRAGSAAVEQKLVTEKDLQALFGSPTMTAAERAHAKEVVGALRGAIETGRLSLPSVKAAGAFIAALQKESDATPRLQAVLSAHKAGVIDGALFARLSAADVGLRPRIELLKEMLPLKGEIDRLTPIADGAVGKDRADLQGRVGRLIERHAQLKAIADSFGADALATAVDQRANLAGNLAGAAVLLLGAAGIVTGLMGAGSSAWEVGYILSAASVFVTLLGPVLAGALADHIARRGLTVEG